MMILKKTESFLDDLLKKIRKNPGQEFRMGILIYTFLFLMIGAGTLGKIIYRTGTIAGADGSAQYFSMFLDFRRNMLNLIHSISEGKFAVKMMNFEFMFGSDLLTTSTYFVLPFFPLYLLSVFFPEELLPAFFAGVVIFLSYLSGISNIIMCRHFKANVLWSCIFAPAYVFCGNYFYTIVWNPQFFSMMIVFPLMIAGIDRILNDKSGLLFILCVAHLGLYGVNLIVYTTPFVVLFAAADLYFLNKKKYFRRLAKYFCKGMICFITGLALAAFFFLPYLYTVTNTLRNPGEIDNLKKMLIPSADYLTDVLYCYDINRPVGVCPVLIPFLLLCVFSVKSEKKHKFLVSGALIIFSLPLVWYGMNGFMYSLCRWGFVASCLYTFIAAYYAPEAFKRSNGNVFLLLNIAFFLIAFPFKLTYILCSVIIAAALITSFSTVYNKIFLIINHAKKLYIGLNPKVKRYLKMILLIIVVISVILFTEIFLVSPYYNISKGMLYVFISFVLITILIVPSKKADVHLVVSLIGVVLLSASNVIYLVTCRNELNPAHTVRADPFYQNLSSYGNDSETFGRFSSVSQEKNMYIPDSSFEYRKAENESHVLSSGEKGINTVERNKQANLALKYTLPSSEIFSSTIDRDYMEFLKRCGMDYYSLVSVGETHGYSNKEVIYSLMGIKYMYSNYESTSIYGLIPDNNFKYKEKYLFINKYALPVGVTYDKVISKEKYDSFNSAELPYAMMNSVYLENYTDSFSLQDQVYSKVINKTLERTIKESSHVNYDFTNNKITLDDDVSGGFVYMHLKNVNYDSFPQIDQNKLHLIIDGKDECVFSIVNNNAEWQWNLPRDHYVLSLGFCKETIHTIEFMAFFDFDDVEIIYVPENVYTSGYEKITEEILENVELGNNTLTGDITVSSDKVLSIDLLHNDGWTAYVDGVKTPVYKANGLFLGIKLKEGTHKIRLVYRTPFLYEGMVISGFTLVLLVVVYIAKKKNGKQICLPF